MGWTVKAQDSLKTVQLDEVVVTGTKAEIPIEKSGKSIFKISQKDIEKSSGKTVSDLLNEVPGVQMDGNFGPMGTNIGYFIRGASSKRTLILIDGVPFNDASGIDQTYDLRLLDLDQVESIEVLKGGLSTLYGTGAAAGVINIQLKEAKSDAFGGKIGAEYGSFNTLHTNLNLSGSQENFTYLVNGGYKKSDGFSAAQDETNSGDFDDDGFEGYNLLGRLGYRFSDEFSLELMGAFDDFSYDYDASEFTDANNTSDYNQLRFGLSTDIGVGAGRIKGNVFYSKLNRFFNTPQGFSPTTEYDAENIQGDFFVDHNLSDNLKLIGGLNYQNLSYSQPALEESGFNMIDPYISFIYDKNDFNIQIGGRLNNHSEYGNNFVYNLNPSYLIGFDNFNVKVFGSYATAFIAPSLFQLFGPFGANLELQPEESQSVEVGSSLLSQVMNLDFVYYHRADENLIIFLTDSYENAGEKIETSGIELNTKIYISEDITLSSHYTYTNVLGDDPLYRIPAHKYGASLGFQLIDQLNVTTTYLHTGKRDQPFFNNQTFMTEVVETGAFDLVDLSASYDINHLRFKGSIINLFDEDYVAVYGFNAVGRNYHLGVSYSF